MERIEARNEKCTWQRAEAEETGMQGKGRMSLRSCRRLVLTLVLATALLLPGGCGIVDDSAKKLRDLEFTVLPESEIPTEYLDFILENKSQPMKLTYCSEEYLYIAVGYGQQETGGYSISVDELYLTENGITIDTTIHGPSVSETDVEGVSYPYIVVKTEKMDVPVIFQ